MKPKQLLELLLVEITNIIQNEYYLIHNKYGIRKIFLEEIDGGVFIKFRQENKHKGYNDHIVLQHTSYIKSYYDDIYLMMYQQFLRYALLTLTNTDYISHLTGVPTRVISIDKLIKVGFDDSANN